MRGTAEFAVVLAAVFAAWLVAWFADWAAMGRAVSDINASASPIGTAAFILNINRFRIFNPPGGVIIFRIVNPLNLFYFKTHVPRCHPRLHLQYNEPKPVKPFRIALANIRFPATPEESIALAVEAVGQASSKGARIVCFPECFVPGYRVGKCVPPPDAEFLERAWSVIAKVAGKANITVVLGTERLIDGALVATALVIDQDGSIAGFQDKVQIDPSEEGTYAPGCGRRVFEADPVTFGIAICHEGWRYPETVRWAARRGARIVFHPHFHEAGPDSYRPAAFADPANTFHEKAALCRAAENNCYFASVNFASPGSPTTSAIVRPDGTLLSYQPYGEEGLLIADIDLAAATGLLASRYRTVS